MIQITSHTATPSDTSPSLLWYLTLGMAHHMTSTIVQKRITQSTVGYILKNAVNPSSNKSFLPAIVIQYPLTSLAILTCVGQYTAYYLLTKIWSAKNRSTVQNDTAPFFNISYLLHGTGICSTLHTHPLAFDFIAESVLRNLIGYTYGWHDGAPTIIL